jgi:H+/gluconate symporter-like permease
MNRPPSPESAPRNPDPDFNRGQAPSSMPPSQRNKTPWQPRFGIREMLMLMLICSMLAAALGYLYQDEKNGGKSMRFIFLTVAGPTLMATALGITFVIYELLHRRKRKKKAVKPDDLF